MRLEVIAAEERAVLIRFEIGKADDDGFWMEGGGDLSDAVDKIVNVETLSW